MSKGKVIALVIVLVFIGAALYYYKKNPATQPDQTPVKTDIPPIDTPVNKGVDNTGARMNVSGAKGIKIDIMADMKPKSISAKIADLTEENAAKWGIQNPQLNPFLNPAVGPVIVAEKLKKWIKSW